MTPRVSTAKPTSARGQVARIRRLKFGASDWGPARRSSWVFATNSDRVFSSSCCTWRARVSVRFWSMMACWCSRTTCWSRAERTASQASARLGRRMAARKIQMDRRIGFLGDISKKIKRQNLCTTEAQRHGESGSFAIVASHPSQSARRVGHPSRSRDGSWSEDFSVVVDGGEDVVGVQAQPGIVARREEYFGVDLVVEVGERHGAGVPEQAQNSRAQEVVIADGVERDGTGQTVEHAQHGYFDDRFGHGEARGLLGAGIARRFGAG